MAAMLASLVACTNNDDIAEWTYVCGTTEEAAFKFGGGPDACGYDDTQNGKLPPEPSFPAEVCATVEANKAFPDESNLDTTRITDALKSCSNADPTQNRFVKLVASGANNVFVTSSFTINSAILWVDKGVTLYASRDPTRYDITGNCGRAGVNDSGACSPYITVTGTSPGIYGEGVIDGQGGEPLVGHDYSWWQLSYALRSVDGSIGNPTLIQLSSTTGFVMYRITLHNSPKFHVKLASHPADNTCDAPGEGFIVWGVTVLTPSNWYNSLGFLQTPFFSRNSDAIDPGANGPASCGVIACSTISTGDDHIAIKGGNHVSDLVIAHNHFGTGHGISIGSETYGGVENVEVYDLTIDSDSRWTGAPKSDTGEGDANGGENGIRIKSDVSRGGVVQNIRYHDICMRDVTNAIIVTPGYNPMFAGDKLPQYKDIEFRNIRYNTCLSQQQGIVTFRGLDSAHPAGPITLDNVIIDNIGPQAVATDFADLQLGPGNVNFMPTGRGVTVTNNITGGSTPRECKYAPLPVPPRPEGWLW